MIASAIHCFGESTFRIVDGLVPPKASSTEWKMAQKLDMRDQGNASLERRAVVQLRCRLVLW